MRTAFVLAGMLLLLAPPLLAQRTLEVIGRDAEHGVRDALYIWTAPFHADADDLPAMAGVASATLLAGAVDGAVMEWVRDHPRALPVRALEPFREGEPLSTIGLAKPLLMVSAVLYGVGWTADSDALREAGVGCAVSDLTATTTRHLLARLVGRLRPAYGGPYVFELFRWSEWRMRSFPGGHAANIMACTAFWSNRFDLGAAEPALYLLATGISLGRIVDEAHWLSDTVFGAAWGWAIGAEVADRMAARDPEAGEPGDARLILTVRVPF